MAHDVFISYSRANKVAADAICNRLECDRIRCWYAPRDVPGGADYRTAIVEAIGHSQVFVLVFSTEANRSKDVLSEVHLAFEKELVIVPYRIEAAKMCPALEYNLAGRHWIDAFDSSEGSHLDALARRILEICGSAPAAPLNCPDTVDARQVVQQPSWPENARRIVGEARQVITELRSFV